METQSNELSTVMVTPITTASADTMHGRKINYFKMYSVYGLMLAIVATPIVLALKFFKRSWIAWILAVLLSVILVIGVLGEMAFRKTKLFDFYKK